MQHLAVARIDHKQCTDVQWRRSISNGMDFLIEPKPKNPFFDPIQKLCGTAHFRKRVKSKRSPSALETQPDRKKAREKETASRRHVQPAVRGLLLALSTMSSN
jgi:hypothetical protein